MLKYCIFSIGFCMHVFQQQKGFGQLLTDFTIILACELIIVIESIEISIRARRGWKPGKNKNI